ncbi:MAG: hypothetical protein Q4F85_15300 [Prevotella sp.]|nr:hypothetical protein [Prevotella sp.]
MAKELIRITLTEFMNYVNKSGSAKMTVVTKSKTRHEEEYQTYKDYWLKLRENIKHVHRNNLSKEELYTIIDEVSDDKKSNYSIAIEGYCKFWGKKKITWCTPPRKTWAVGSIRVELNPELGLIINNKTFYIKIFTTANDTLDRRHADLILALMKKELKDKVDEDALFAVLDIKKGKLFEYDKNKKDLYTLLKAEALGFETIWLSI